MTFSTKPLSFTIIILLLMGSCKQQVVYQSSNTDINAYNYALSADFDNSKKEFEKSIGTNPKSAKSYYGLGYSYFYSGDIDRAITYLNKAVEIDPDFTMAYYAKGEMESLNGDSEEAIVDFTEAIDLKSDFSYAYYHRSAAFANIGNHKKLLMIWIIL
jgi:tetratricopeptide (TPR) repeat protein